MSEKLKSSPACCGAESRCLRQGQRNHSQGQTATEDDDQQRCFEHQIDMGTDADHQRNDKGDKTHNGCNVHGSSFMQ